MTIYSRSSNLGQITTVVFSFLSLLTEAHCRIDPSVQEEILQYTPIYLTWNVNVYSVIRTLTMLYNSTRGVLIRTP